MFWPPFFIRSATNNYLNVPWHLSLSEFSDARTELNFWWKTNDKLKPDLLWDFVALRICVHFGSTSRRMHGVRLRITSGCWSDIRLRLTRVRLRTHLLWFAKKCQTHKQFLCFPKYRSPCGGKQNNGVSKPSFHTLLLHLRPQPERRAIKSRNPKIDANKSKKSRTM